MNHRNIYAKIFRRLSVNVLKICFINTKNSRFKRFILFIAILRIFLYKYFLWRGQYGLRRLYILIAGLILLLRKKLKNHIKGYFNQEILCINLPGFTTQCIPWIMKILNEHSTSNIKYLGIRRKIEVS